MGELKKIRSRHHQAAMLEMAAAVRAALEAAGWSVAAAARALGEPVTAVQRLVDAAGLRAETRQRRQ